jgi:CshA-type fibril repeat protein
LLAGSLALALVFAGARTATAYEAPAAAFSGGVSTMTGSGLTQTWTASGATSLTGGATTAGSKGYTASLYTPSLTTSTPTETVTTAVDTCAVTDTCSGLGTLTVTFAHPVVNPVIHFAGLGDNVGAVLFHVTLTLTTSGLTVSKVGTGANYKVVGSTITAVDDKTSGSCTSYAAPTTAPAVCGSFRLNGTVTSATFAIGAVSTDTSSAGVLTNGADEYSILATVDQDYGDAPASYDAGNAARAVVSDIRLGEQVTADDTTTLNATASPNAGATAKGDGESDDGVEPKSIAVLATTYKVTVQHGGASSPWEVCGWVDFNSNGIFDDSERQCKAGTGNGETDLTWTGLSGLVIGTTYARFRIGYNVTQTQSPTGPSDSGEVEDYAVSISPVATPTAAPDSPTTLQDVNVTFNPLANDTADPLTSLDPTKVLLRDPLTTIYGTSVTITGEGTYTVNPTTGFVTFDPLPPFVGSATPITYRVADTFGQTATSMITPMVTPVVPAPVNDSASTPFNTPATVSVLTNDLPGEPSSPLVPSSVELFDSLTSTYVSSVSIPGEGSYSVNATTGAVTFTPEPMFRGPATPITYRVADDNGTTATATLTMTVGAPPSPAPADDSVTTLQGVAVTLSTLLNDAPSTLGAALVPALVMLKDPVSSTFQSSVSVANEGTWTVDPATGVVTFTPLLTFAGTATAITYRVADTNGATAEAVEHVSVSAVIPTANPDSTTTPYETPVTLTVVGNDVAGDPSIALVPSSVQLRDPGDNAWKSSVTLTGIGTYAVQLDDSVTFTPVQGYTGTSSVPYRIADANGTYAQSTVSVTVSNPPAPVAWPDTATTAQGVPVTVFPLSNDTSDPAAPLNPASVKLLDGPTPVATLTVPGEGTYTVNPANGSVTFTPLPTFHGSATPVQYQVADEAVQLATSTISVEVTAVTPSATPDSATTPYAHAVTVPLLTNDVEGALTAPLVPGSVQLLDSADSTWKTSVTTSGVGTYVVNPVGSVTFTPAIGYSGTTADLPYRVADTNGTYAQSTVHVTVGAAPEANPDSGTTPQGVQTTVGLLGNDSPGSGATLVPSSVQLLDASASTYKTSITIANQGTYSVNPADGKVTFTPVPTYHGNATPITYEVADSDGNIATSTLSIVVNEVTPAAQPDIGFTPYETSVTVPLLANDVAGDPDVGLVPASVKLFDQADTTYKSSVTLTGVGTYVVQPDGSVVFTPAQGFTGTTPAVTYLVDDANGTMATSTVSVTVSNPPAPVATPDSATTPQGVPVTLDTLSNDTSDPAAPLDPASVRILDPGDTTYKSTVTILGQGTYGVDGSTGKVLFTPVLSFHGTATTLTYRVADEAGQLATSTLSVTVDPITPTAAPDSATTPYLHGVTVPLLTNDAEGASTAPLVPGSVQLQDPADSGWKTSLSVPGMGTYVVQPDGSVTFTPQAGYSGTTPALPYRVADTNGTYAVSEVTITVGAPPTASPDTATTPQGLQVTIDVTGNDTPGTGATIVPSSVLLEDPANPGSWLPVVTVPGEGTYALDPTGGVVFTPGPTFHGTATAVTYRALDSDGNAAISSVTVTVTPVIPVATPDTTTTPYETTVNVPLLGNDHPGDPGVPLTPASVRLKDPADSAWKSSVSLSGVGTYTVQPDGSVDFVPAQGYTGTTSALPYRVADANGTLTQSTVQVTVGMPAAPAAADDLATTLQGTPVTLPTLGNDTSDPAAPLDPASVKLLDHATGTYKASVTIPGEGTYVVDPTSGDVTFTPLKPFHGTATPVTYEVKDEAGQVTMAAIKVVVTAVTPTATPDSATTPYAHAVTVQLVSDDSAGDPSIPLVPSSLTLKDPSGGVWKTTVTVAGVGTYTANPDGSVGFVPAPGYTGTTTALPYRVADGNGTYAESTITITVQTAPHATPDTATTLQGQPVTVSPLTNDTAGGTATLVLSSVLLLDPSEGTYKTAVTLAGEGTYTVDPVTHDVHFAPVLTFSGPAAPVTYHVTDSDGNTATSTITITVTPVIPVALPDNSSTPYAHSVNIPLLTNDHAGDPVVPLIPASVELRNPTTGVWATTVTVAGVGTYVVQPDGSVTFTPAAGFIGTTASLSYRVADSNGTVTASTVSVVVGAPPVAAPDTTTTLQNQPVTLATLTNDQPGTSATLVPSSVELVDPSTGFPQPVVMVPNQGTYAVDSTTGEITFQPVPWFSGSASAITYQVSDSNGNTATSWVSVHVTAVVPAVVADSATTPFRTPVTIPVLANDAPGDATAPLVTTSVVLEDPADGTWKTTVTVPDQGTLAVQPDGQVVFTPAADYQGTVHPVMYRVTDANGTTRTATIHVVIGNAPVAAPDTATTLQGHPVTLPLLANDHPGTGGTLVPGTTQLLDPADGTYKASVTIADEGTWTVDPATGAVTFTPLSTYVGHSTPITYEVTDSFGNTATSTARATIAEVVPTASGDTATTPFRTPVTVAVLANDSPGRADTPLDPTTVHLNDPVTGNWVTTVTDASVGTSTVKADGSVTFTPVATYVGVTAPLSYQVADINGTYAQSTLVVTVDAPYGAKSDSDSANGSGTDPVTLNPLANDTPSKGATWILSSVCLLPDSAKTIAGTALGSNPKTAVVAGVGTWVVNSDGTMTFTPVAGFTGTASIGYLVTDTNGVEVANTVLVTVTKLPNTGGPVVFVGALGVMLLLVGGVLLLIGRRRRGHL